MILKFRAWDKETKTMNGMAEIYRNRNQEIELRPRDENIILMQSTGLKDKNGKEIFEGDIVKCSGLLGTIELFKAMWICSFVRYNNNQKVGFFAQEIEVVGNIYENPELLEEKE